MTKPGVIAMASKRRKPGKGQATPPSFLSAPSIIGTPVAGNASAYTPGTVAGNPVPTVARQWRLDGADIVGETGATYTPIEADAGKTLTIRETATNVNGSASGTSAGKAVTSTAATAVVLTGPSGGTVGAASAPFTVTANGTLAGNVMVNFSDGGAGGTFSPSPSVVLTPSATSAQVAYTAASEGLKAISITNTGGLTNSGTPIGYTASALAWTFGDGATVNTGANTSTSMASSVPTGATIAYASPDLLPGQTLQKTGSTVNVIGDATVPTVNGDVAGSLEDAVSARDVVIEVLDSPIATIVNVTRGITYEYGTDYTGRTSDQPANRWNAAMWECNPGDIIEVSPGAIMGAWPDWDSYWNSVIGSVYLAVIKPCTIRNMAGRGRWRVLPEQAQLTTGNNDGICIFAPSQLWTPGRGSFTLEGFHLDNWGRYGDGVRIRNDATVAGSWAHMHSSVTLRNFKIGRLPGGRSFSGINGAAETLLLEDGHVHDCGGRTAVGTAGQNHNFYISARTLTLRGIRNQRTRGWGVPPSGANWNDDNKLVEGHLAKMSAVTGSVEGCVFDCGSMASATDVSDTSLLMQLKAGGNWTVRGSLFIDTQAPNVANGAINMCREYSTDGVTPNFEWWAGSEGNSLLFERNVFVGHWRRPILWFFTPSQSANQAMYASGDTSVAAERRLSSLTVRDNIAIMAATAQYGSQWVLPDFPGTNNSMWINNDPNGGGTWSARGNTTRSYSRAAYAFDKRELLAYTDALGAPAASQGSASVPQFLWPHGYRNVTRSTQGLG